MPQAGAHDLLRLLAPFPGRLEFTVRLALICTLTTLVTAIYGTPDAALTVYVVFFMNKPGRTTSLILNVVFVILVSAMIGLVFLLARVVIDEPFWRVMCIAIVSFGFLFLASASKLEPVASTLALIVAYALDLLGSAPTSDLITRGLLYAWLFVGIPAGVSIVVNLLLAPAPRRVAEKAIAERLLIAAEMLREPGGPIRQKFRTCLYEGSTEILKAVKLAGLERSAPKQDLAALGQAARSTTAILLLIDMMDRESIVLPDAVRSRIAATFNEMAVILKNGGYPVEAFVDISESAQSLSPLAAQLLDDLRQAVAEFAEPPADSHLPAAKKEGGFFVPDAFTSPVHIQYALKATAAAMICYLLYSLLNWPGIHTAFLTCYIVSLGTTAETVEKLTLRIAGCLLGAVIGIGTIVFVVPYLTSVGALIALIFIGTLGAAWVAAGTPRISYAGFQIAFAFFLCVIQGAKPGFDLVVARDRVIGILLGNIVVYLIFTNAWPVSVKKRIDAATAQLLRSLGAMAATASRPARLLLASHSQAELGALEQNLMIARYEPEGVRPSPNWLNLRGLAMTSVERLIGPLYLAAQVDVAGSANAGERLDSFAARLAPESLSADESETKADNQDRAAPGEPDAVAIALRQRIDAGLRDLQDALTDPSTEPQAASYASA